MNPSQQRILLTVQKHLARLWSVLLDAWFPWTRQMDAAKAAHIHVLAPNSPFASFAQCLLNSTGSGVIRQLTRQKCLVGAVVQLGVDATSANRWCRGDITALNQSLHGWLKPLVKALFDAAINRNVQVVARVRLQRVAIAVDAIGDFNLLHLSLGKPLLNRCRLVLKRIATLLIQLPTGLQASLLICLLYTSPSPRDRQKSRMPASA